MKHRPLCLEFERDYKEFNKKREMQQVVKMQNLKKKKRSRIEVIVVPILLVS